MLSSHGDIERLCGKLEGWNLPAPKIELRRKNRIRAIQGSLAIEGNALTLDQVTAVLEGKRVLGPPKDVLEVRNAIRAYGLLETFEPFSSRSFLKAHGLMMEGLLGNPGRWREGDAGIQKGKKATHVAPPDGRVPKLMEGLFRSVRSESGISYAMRSCIFHYEMAFIHPFMDGNGRMARLWQTLLLSRRHPVFAFVPVESMVRKKQAGYYRALEAADKAGEATPFMEYMLAAISQALSEFILEPGAPPQSAASRLAAGREYFGARDFSRKDYLRHFKTISTATASRDLREGAANGSLKKSGEMRMSRYRFKR